MLSQEQWKVSNMLPLEQWRFNIREHEGGDQSHHSQRDWPKEEDHKKTASDGTHRQTTDRHRNLDTESGQWADSEKTY